MINKEFPEKIKKFVSLMKEISNDITDIYMKQQEEQYHDYLIQMLEALDEAQQTVRKAFGMDLNRSIEEN